MKKKYLIVGSGRLAKNLIHWFTLKNIPFSHWHYKTNTTESFHNFTSTADRILLAIPDRAIAEFILKSPAVPMEKWLHFSGSLYVPGIANFHPMMSFTEQLMSEGDYEQIQFAYFVDPNQPTISDTNGFFISELSNKCFPVSIAQKKLYHALCSFTGNLTSMLWTMGAQDFIKLGVPESAVHFYQKKIFENLQGLAASEFHKSLTGPLVRGDTAVLTKQFEELKKNQLADIYQSTIQTYQEKVLHQKPMELT